MISLKCGDIKQKAKNEQAKKPIKQTRRYRQQNDGYHRGKGQGGRQRG